MRHRLLRFWRRLRRRVIGRLTRMTVRATAPVTGRGLFLTRKDRERARSMDEFNTEYALHRELEAAADRCKERGDGWLNRRPRDRY